MSKKYSWITLVPIFAGLIFSAWYFMIGGLLVSGLSFKNSVLALVIGNVILLGVFYKYGGLGQRLNASSSQIAEGFFGTHGSKYFFSVLISVGQIGWFVIIAGIGGRALGKIISMPVEFSISIYAIASILVAIAGLRAISYLKVFLTGATMILAFMGLNNAINVSVAPQNETSFFFAGVGIVIAALISFCTVTPDYMKHLMTQKDVFLSSFFGFFIPAMLAGVLGIVFTITLRTWDIVKIISTFTSSEVANWFLIIASVSAATSIFAPGVIMSSVMGENTEHNRRRWTLVAGIIGIIFILIGFNQYFETWVTLVGALYAPIIGIGIVHHSMKEKKAEEKWNIDGIMAWVLGCFVGLISNEPGINLIFAGIIAAITYGFLVDLNILAAYRKYFKSRLV